MEPEEAGARDEGHRDEEEARVVETAGSLTRQEAQHDADRCGAEHEPEVGRVVLPVCVEVRRRQDQNEACDRNC
jgi:hypothetical protein